MEDKKNLWKALFMILAALLGFSAGEVVDTVTEVECEECAVCAAPEKCDSAECPIRNAAYVNNCKTGETDKYWCDCIGEGCICKTAEEILSQLG